MRFVLSNISKSQKRAYFVLVLPLIFAVILLMVIPFLTTISYSLTNYRINKPNDVRFIGLQNFFELARDTRFWNSIVVALEMVICPVSIQLVLGISVALLLHRGLEINRRVRVLFLLPMMVPPIVNGIIWRLFFTPAVPGMNYLLSLIGIRDFVWFDKPLSAFSAVMIANIWSFTPFVILMILAALESLPADPFESALIDGANRWQIFSRLTVPMIKPTLIFVATYRAIDALKIFPLIYVMTEGGPGHATEPLNYYIYLTSFQFLKIGYGSAQIIILVLICILMVLISQQIRSKT